MSIITRELKKRSLDLLISLLSNDSYVFFSKHKPWAVDSVPDGPNVSETEIFDAWDEMVFAKKITSSSVAAMISRYDWTSGVTYADYEDDVSLETARFFVLTAARHVFKCLKSPGTASTVEPSLTTTTPFSTADGYTWKYMFTVPQDLLDSLGTTTLFPFYANNTIESAAVPGTLDRIKVTSTSNGWISNTGTVEAAVTNNIFKISASANTSNSFYNGSAMVVLSGGGAGYLSPITDHYANSSGNFLNCTVANSSVGLGSVYYISPAVIIRGDGSGASAYSVVNNTSRGIHDITMLSFGNGYSWATATCNASYSANASLDAVISPKEGHGSDPVKELHSQSVGAAVTASINDSLLKGINVRTIGILHSPNTYAGALASNASYNQYSSANVVINVSSPVPSAGELITGQTSGATAVLVQANSTVLKYTNLRGTIAVSETLVSNTSASVFTVSAINTPGLQALSGEIFYVNSFEPIQTSDFSVERVKVIIGI